MELNYRSQEARLSKVKELSLAIGKILKCGPANHTCYILAHTVEQLGFKESRGCNEYNEKISFRLKLFMESLEKKWSRLDELTKPEPAKIRIYESNTSLANRSHTAGRKRMPSNLNSAIPDPIPLFKQQKVTHPQIPQSNSKVDQRFFSNPIPNSNHIHPVLQAKMFVSNEDLAQFLQSRGLLESFVDKAKKFSSILQEEQCVPSNDITNQLNKVQQYVQYSNESLAYMDRCREGYKPSSETLDVHKSAIRKIESAYHKIDKKVGEYEIRNKKISNSYRFIERSSNGSTDLYSSSGAPEGNFSNNRFPFEDGIASPVMGGVSWAMQHSKNLDQNGDDALRLDLTNFGDCSSGFKDFDALKESSIHDFDCLLESDDLFFGLAPSNVMY
mmetsp:Transcript_57/g.60  ORF Transcript_57/g.60 Transcript_57/m.60 type:complete len:387 (-) Transcript_57:189-1349(-)